MKDFAPKKLHEQVFEQVRDQIRQGVYRQGDVLPSEKELMEHMGVSRATVRQALQRLGESGIIKTYKGKGSVVAVDWGFLQEQPQRKTIEAYMRDFEESTEVRRLIEPMIAKQVALCATAEDIARMEQAMLYEDAGLPQTFNEAERDTKGLPDFHRSIADSLHNPLLSRLLEEFIFKSAAPPDVPLVPPTRQKQHKEAVERQHRNIFEAIKNHDPEYAYFHMLQHCDWISETYDAYFKDFLK